MTGQKEQIQIVREKLKKLKAEEKAVFREALREDGDIDTEDIGERLADISDTIISLTNRLDAIEGRKDEKKSDDGKASPEKKSWLDSLIGD